MDPGVLTEMYSVHVKNFAISYSIYTSYNNNNAHCFNHSSSSSTYNIVSAYILAWIANGSGLFANDIDEGSLTKQCQLKASTSLVLQATRVWFARLVLARKIGKG